MTNTPTTPAPLETMPSGARPDIWSLLQVLRSIDGVKAIALVSVDGQAVASVGLDKGSEATLIANTAALLSLGERASQAFRQGPLEIVLTKAAGGSTLVVGAGENAALAMLFDASVDLIKLFPRDFPLIDKIRNVIKSLY